MADYPQISAGVLYSGKREAGHPPNIAEMGPPTRDGSGVISGALLQGSSDPGFGHASAAVAGSRGRAEVLLPRSPLVA